MASHFTQPYSPVAAQYGAYPQYQQSQIQAQQVTQPASFYPSTSFLNPAGAVYVTNTLQEANNVPVGMGTTVALCLPENLMYIKVSQNGVPLIKQFSLTAVEPKTPADLQQENEELKSHLTTLEEEVRQLKAQQEEKTTATGGSSKWQL